MCYISPDCIKMGFEKKKKLCWSQPCKYNSTSHTHTQSYPKTQQQLQLETEQKWHQQQSVRGENKSWTTTRTNSLKDSCPQTERGQSQPWIISYNKIFKNSLYRGLSSLIYTLIYGKETTKIYMYKFIYICHVYISINHFKSLCGKKKTMWKKRHRARDREQKKNV